MKDVISKFETKNLIKLGMIVIIIIVCIIGFSLIYYNFFYQKSYQEIEEIMVNAAKHYYSEREEELPKTPGESKMINAETLAANDYMKNISDYLKNEDIACKATVNITNINKRYRFNPLLDCGRYYKYELIVDKIKDSQPIVTASEGLYQVNDELIYRGEKINNYVSFADAKWRIIKISNNKLILIYNDKLDKTVWDDRYNKEKRSNYGVNNYEVSRIKEYLNKLYKNSKFLKINDKLLVTNYSLQTGKVGENDDDRNGNLAKSNMLNNQYIGLISAYDFMNASLDNDCTEASSSSCTNYNFLADYDYNYWTLTGDKNASYKVYRFNIEDNIYPTRAASTGYVRPVIAIVDDALYVSGDGSSSKPYVFK